MSDLARDQSGEVNGDFKFRSLHEVNVTELSFGHAEFFFYQREIGRQGAGTDVLVLFGSQK